MSRDSQLTTLIILYMCFSTHFMFDCASICEITCLWNRHFRRQVCEFIIINYIMKKNVEIVLFFRTLAIIQCVAAVDQTSQVKLDRYR